MKKLSFFSFALGCMGMTGFYGKADKAQCIQTIRKAFELGITHFDTADNYGSGENEILLGSAVAPIRDQITIATKVGVVRSKDSPHVTINGKPDYIKRQCEVSLKRLGISTIDLYYLHHVDPSTPIEETIQAMAELVGEGRVRHIGLGEMSAENIRRAHKVHPITAIQAEYSLFSREAERHLLPLCKELDITFIACAPLSRGLLAGISSFVSGDFRPHFPRFEPANLAHNLTIVSQLKKVALAKSCTLPQLALSWVANQSAIPLFGTTKTNHLQENIKKVDLSQTEIEAMNQIVLKGGVKGHRHTEMMKHLYEL